MKNVVFVIVFMLVSIYTFSQRSSILAPSMVWDSIAAITDTTSGEIIYCSNCKEDGTGLLVVFNKGSWETLNGETLDIPSTPTLDTIIVSLDQIVWDWDTVSDATGYRWNITNTYSTATNMNTTTSRTETSLSCNTKYTRYVWAYNEYGHSAALTMSDTTLACFDCDTMTIIHTAGTTAPVTDTILYNVYKGLTGESTLCWLTQNLGASQEASSKSDTSHAALGWYWQFGAKQGYQYIDSTRTPGTAWPGLVGTSTTWASANDPCTILLGNEWRLPTSTEFYNVDLYNNWNNVDSTFNSELKLHAAGNLYSSTGESQYKGVNGYYWTSSAASTTYGKAYLMTSSRASLSSYYKTAGCSVRCVHEQ